MKRKRSRSKLKKGLEIYLLLSILVVLLGVTGTVFFGVDLANLILSVIVVALIVKEFQDDLKRIRWIKKKLDLLMH